MSAFRPKLPPRLGHVEVGVEGKRVYRNVATGLLIDPTAAPTPADLREEAYNTQTIIEWDGTLLTVTQAAQLWQYYAAEGSTKADELQALIAAAKQTIREQYPDEGVSE